MSSNDPREHASPPPGHRDPYEPPKLDPPWDGRQLRITRPVRSKIHVRDLPGGLVVRSGPTSWLGMTFKQTDGKTAVHSLEGDFGVWPNQDLEVEIVDHAKLVVPE